MFGNRGLGTISSKRYRATISGVQDGPAVPRAGDAVLALEAEDPTLHLPHEVASGVPRTGAPHRGVPSSVRARPAPPLAIVLAHCGRAVRATARFGRRRRAPASRVAGPARGVGTDDRGRAGRAPGAPGVRPPRARRSVTSADGAVRVEYERFLRRGAEDHAAGSMRVTGDRPRRARPGAAPHPFLSRRGCGSRACSRRPGGSSPAGDRVILELRGGPAAAGAADGDDPPAPAGDRRALGGRRRGARARELGFRQWVYP